MPYAGSMEYLQWLCNGGTEVKHSKWRGSLSKDAKHKWDVMTNYQLKTFVKSEIRNNLIMGDLLENLFNKLAGATTINDGA